MPEQRTMTIAEAAEATGLTKKALGHRCDRGQLRHVKARDGIRRIPVSELVRHQLLTPDGRQPDLLPGSGGGDVPAARGLESELLDRLERQASELGRFRQIEQQSQSIERQLADAERARLQLIEHLNRAQAENAALRAQLDRPRLPRLLRRRAA